MQLALQGTRQCMGVVRQCKGVCMGVAGCGQTV